MPNSPRAKWVLPLTISPATSICWRVPVPDDPFHQAAFLGALATLGSGASWADDPGHNAREVARVWRDIADNLAKCGPLTIIAGGAEGGDEQMIRQNPDNPCELQTSIDGATWCTFADFSKCLPAAPQPGGGSVQPASGGGQVCYRGEMPASALWLLPTLVSSGDVLELSSITGAGNDGAQIRWACPSGLTFFGGACVPNSGATDGGDPLPSVLHMRMLYLIDGVYYDAMAGAFNVPGGITNKEVDLLVNDSALADNVGSYQFEVCVTNNAASLWSHTFDFALNDGGFIPVFSCADRATYVLGTGWTSVWDPCGSSTNEIRIIRSGLPSTGYIGEACVYDASIAPTQLQVYDGGMNLLPLSAGSNIHAAGTGPTQTVTEHRFDLIENGSGVSQTYVLSSLTVSGVGVDPF